MDIPQTICRQGWVWTKSTLAPDLPPHQGTWGPFSGGLPPPRLRSKPLAQDHPLPALLPSQTGTSLSLGGTLAFCQPRASQGDRTSPPSVSGPHFTSPLTGRGSDTLAQCLPHHSSLTSHGLTLIATRHRKGGVWEHLGTSPPSRPERPLTGSRPPSLRLLAAPHLPQETSGCLSHSRSSCPRAPSWTSLLWGHSSPSNLKSDPTNKRT